MQRPSEILFVDPVVSDLETILGNLRSEVHAILLNARSPVTRQIATALEEYRGLDAIHVIAHGAPGRVSFAGGEWSAGTLKEAACDFAAIGRALAADGELRLWSCETALGDAGEAFVEALSEAIGADVRASTSMIGAAALGGTWEMSARASASMPLPPLTSDGVSFYAGVLSEQLTLTGSIAAGSSNNINTFFIVDTSITGSEVVGSFVLPSATNATALLFGITITVPGDGVYTIWDSGFGGTGLYGTITVVGGVAYLHHH